MQTIYTPKLHANTTHLHIHTHRYTYIQTHTHTRIYMYPQIQTYMNLYLKTLFINKGNLKKITTKTKKYYCS